MREFITPRNISRTHFTGTGGVWGMREGTDLQRAPQTCTTFVGMMPLNPHSMRETMIRTSFANKDTGTLHDSLA